MHTPHAVAEPWLTASAAELAALVREGKITSRDLVDAHIAHAQAVNPQLNAIVVERYAQARAEADAADAAVARGDALGPLHGVPCTIKESFAMQGMPHTAGLLSRVGLQVDEDAITVARWRAAGAIPLGVTNTSELCMWYESNNRVYGRSNNPYNPRHIVGGSSGGEGAIVGSGASPFGLGADIGGSIRMPAFFNGVFGHKTTGGMVPGSGQHPPAHGDALRYLCTGPICRRAADLEPLTRLLAGPDGADEECVDMPFGDPADVDVRDLTVTVVDYNGMRRVHPELRDGMKRAADALKARGARVRYTHIDGMKRSLDLWSHLLSAAGGQSFNWHLGGGGERRMGGEFLRWAMRRSDHTLPAIFLAAFEDHPLAVPSDYEPSIRAAAQLKQALRDEIGEGGVMLFPPFTRPAPRHHMPLLTPIDFVYTAILNVMELPSTQVPAGLSRKGLPLGMQVVGRHHDDHRTIAVAQWLEEDLGGWVPPWRA